jgi:hypothetical protein
MMFVLSVGSPTPLRQEAGALGLRYQPEPPYRVLSTANLDYKAIRSMRSEFSWLLGLDKHPFDCFDRPHYAINLFCPELTSYSAPAPWNAGAGNGSAPETTSSLIDTIRIDCRGTASGHGHPLAVKSLSARLAQVVQVWFQVADPGACRHHMSETLETLSSPNRHGIWDVILETDREFDPDILEHLVASVRTEVNVVDWDCYFVNPEEGPGHARVSVRPFIIVPLGTVSPHWLDIVSARFPVVHAATVGPDNLEEVLDRAGRLPGEGLLVEVSPDAGAAVVRRLLGGMLSLDRRVLTFRNAALQTLFDRQRLNKPFMRSMLNARIPYRDRAIFMAEADGKAAIRNIPRQQVLDDADCLARVVG